MSTTTTNLSLVKPSNGESVGTIDEDIDIDVINNNYDIIDDFAGAVVGDIATIEASPSTASHSVGEFIIVEGVLYKVIAAIAVGDQLVLNTNVAATSVGSELKSLQDSVATSTIILPCKQASMNSPATLRKVGKTAYLYAAFTSSTAMAASATLYEVPVGYRPASEAKLLGVIRLNTSGNQFTFNDIYVGTNGSVHQIATNNNYGCVLSGMWEIA